jgi:hypothetical protein
VDKKGLAVALIFVVAMCFWIRECSNKTTEQVSNASQEQPDLPAEIQIRSAGSIPREAEFSGPGQSMTVVRREPGDRRVAGDAMRSVSMERPSPHSPSPGEGYPANQERGMPH